MSVAQAEVRAMQAAVLAWYEDNARGLAFRRMSDPWSVLVSEVIAQQTQAARAADAWQLFIARYPTPESLATASPADAIRAWRGLGYNRRAVALRQAAIRIVEGHCGHVPDTYEELVRLRGVGPYTARAVLAIAFNRPVAALDTNIGRVVGRALAGDDTAAARRDFQALADAFVPEPLAATWTHALMDIGAAFCRKRAPRCESCPLAFACRYRLSGATDAKPSARTSGAGATPFPLTSRWLRGRILDRLRDAPDGGWLAFDQPIGEHPIERVAGELGNLARDGLLELGPTGIHARLRTDEL